MSAKEHVQEGEWPDRSGQHVCIPCGSLNPTLSFLKNFGKQSYIRMKIGYAAVKTGVVGGALVPVLLCHAG